MTLCTAIGARIRMWQKVTPYGPGRIGDIPESWRRWNSRKRMGAAPLRSGHTTTRSSSTLWKWLMWTNGTTKTRPTPPGNLWEIRQTAAHMRRTTPKLPTRCASSPLPGIWMTRQRSWWRITARMKMKGRRRNVIPKNSMMKP